MAVAASPCSERSACSTRRRSSRRARSSLVPANQPHLIFAPQKKIVFDQKVAGLGALRPHTHADILETAVAHSQSHRAHHFLLPREDRHLCIAKRQPFEDVMRRRHHIE